MRTLTVEVEIEDPKGVLSVAEVSAALGAEIAFAADRFATSQSQDTETAIQVTSVRVLLYTPSDAAEEAGVRGGVLRREEVPLPDIQDDPPANGKGQYV